MMAKGGRTLMQETARKVLVKKLLPATGYNAKYPGSGISARMQIQSMDGDEESRGRHWGSWRGKCCD